MMFSALLALAPLPAGACAAAAGLELLECEETAAGWFYAPDARLAAMLAADAEVAGDLFERYFGEPAPRGAIVVVGSGGEVPEAQIESLEGIGAKWVLPWLSAEEKQSLREQTLRRAIATQLGAKEDDSRVEPLVAKALAQVTAQDAGKSGDGGADRSALRHEIGHSLLKRAFWPGQAVGAGDAPHYGGPAPDWLDEVAAVLMEDDAMTADRRRALRDLRDSSGGSPGLLPLAEFFVIEHPLKTMAGELVGRPQHGGVRVHLISGPEARELGGQAGWFYAQSRGVADFLIATSRDERIFGAIARAATAGQSTEQWLMHEGESYGLPTTLAELEADWQVWLLAQ
jgi:hypothetical protein